MRQPWPSILLATSRRPAAARPPRRPGRPDRSSRSSAKYPRMKTVHIEKCDRDGDGIYTKTEMLCVQSIYQAMYISD